MVAKYDPKTRLWVSPPEGAPRLKEKRRYELEGEGGDQGFELEDGTRLRGRIRARPKAVTVPTISGGVSAAYTVTDFILSFALLDENDRVVFDEGGKPVVFLHHEVGHAARLNAPDLDAAIEDGWQALLAQMPARIKAFRRGRELAAKYGTVGGE